MPTISAFYGILIQMSIPPIVCIQPHDVAEVTPLEGFRLRVRVYDGLEGEIAMSSLVNSSDAGVFKQLADPVRFCRRVHRVRRRNLAG